MFKLLILFFTFSLMSISMLAQVVVSGKVLHKNVPVENVIIFINNTTSGTTTDLNGQFTLSVKEGKHELIVSHLGFETIKYDLNTSSYNKPLHFSLVEQKTVLNEVVIEGIKYNEDWQNNLSIFKREFIGTTELSKNCTISNPKVLYFRFDAHTSILAAYAKEPLHIINESLGYEINYTLETFTVNKNQIIYSGYAQFTELKGGKNKRKKWRKNRTKAYNGSTMHFFKSVLKKETREEGFIINQFYRKKNEERPSKQEINNSMKTLTSSKTKINFTKKIENPKNAIDSALIVIEKAKLPKYIDYLYKSDIPASDIIITKDEHTYLQFDNNLRVVYTKEKEEKGYVLRNVFSEPRKALPQTSSIIPLIKSTIIYQTGILENPLNIIYEGYWTYKKFADSLPLDYVPTEK